MEYNKIVAITGLPGLYELVNSKPDGAIVRSLDDKSTKFVSSRIHQFSHLESIEIYTVRENVNLIEILKEMKKNEEKLPDEKDDSALKKYFQKVYPDIDFDRVYNSDLKKMVRWYSALDKHNVELKVAEPVEEPVAEESGDKPTSETSSKPKPKTEKKSKGKEEAEETKPAKRAGSTDKTPAKKAAKKKADKSTQPEKSKKTAAKKKTKK